MSRTEAVTRARQKAQAEGRHRLSSILSAEGSEAFERLRPRFATERELVEAGLAALEGAEGAPALTDAELIAELARRLGR